MCLDGTVRRRLRSNNLRCRRPYKGPVLTQRHRQTRLQWTIHQRNWRNRQWRNVIFSDESRYCISTTNGRSRVWRNQGEHYNENCVMETDPWSGLRIMVWRHWPGFKTWSCCLPKSWSRRRKWCNGCSLSWSSTDTQCCTTFQPVSKQDIPTLGNPDSNT